MEIAPNETISFNSIAIIYYAMVMASMNSRCAVLQSAGNDLYELKMCYFPQCNGAPWDVDVKCDDCVSALRFACAWCDTLQAVCGLTSFRGMAFARVIQGLFGDKAYRFGRFVLDPLK